MSGNARGPLMNIAHRGASAYAPENTFASLELAVSLGAEWLEVDVYLTADRRFVVLHDLVLCRPRGDAPWDSARRVGTMASRSLLDVDAGSWFNETRPEYARREFESLSPPLLEDMLRHFNGTAGFFIDVKEPEGNYVVEVELIRALDQCGVSNDDVIVGSLSEACLRKLRSIEPSLKLSQVLALGSQAARSHAELERICCYATTIAAPKEIVDDALVKAAARAGMGVIPFTVNDVLDMHRLADLGVTGLISDYPDRLDEVIGARRRKVAAS